MKREIQEQTSSAKKDNLHPAVSCPPCAPDVEGAYNVNFRSGYRRPRPYRQDVLGVRPDAPDATRSSPPQQPCPLQTLLPSRYTHAPPCMLPLS